MKNDWGWDVRCIYTRNGCGRANRQGRDWTGRVDAQQVVEEGGGINECYAGGIAVLYWVAVSLFLEFVQQWFPGFAEVESPISVDVIWMHLSFSGFSDETIHVAGFRREELGVL
jgi:hypothetical protein